MECAIFLHEKHHYYGGEHLYCSRNRIIQKTSTNSVKFDYRLHGTLMFSIKKIQEVTHILKQNKILYPHLPKNRWKESEEF